MNPSKIKYVIVEPSFLYVRGLIFFLQQIRRGEVSIFSNVKDLLSHIAEENPDLLLINEKLHNSRKKQVRFWQEKLNFNVLLLADKNSLNNTNALCYQDDKNNVYLKISKAIDEIEKENSENRLTKREEVIVRKIAEGLSNKEIANILSISIHTVMTHRKNIIRKLRINSVSGLTVYAIINQLVDIKDFNN